MAFEITWRGASEQSYKFEAYPNGQKFNTVSGVYIFCKPLASGNWEALYVGETESFYQRLNAGKSNHNGLERAERLGMTHVCVMIVNGGDLRLRIETDLRHSLNPPANAQSVSGRAF